MKRREACGLIAALSALFFGCARSTADIPAVGNFDPQRYMGVWYEIARLPHRFERGLDFVRAEYTLNSDGSIRVVNSGIRDGAPRSIVGRARLKSSDAATPKGELEVSFFRPFYGDYRIIELGPGYRYAVVTGSTRDYLWILAREPVMDQAVMGELLARIARWGFAVDKLEFPRHSAAAEKNATRSPAPDR